MIVEGISRIKRGQERDTLALAFAAMTLPVDLACPGIKGREQVQSPIAPIRMRDAVGDARLGGLRGMEPGARLHEVFSSRLRTISSGRRGRVERVMRAVTCA